MEVAVRRARCTSQLPWHRDLDFPVALSCVQKTLITIGRDLTRIMARDPAAHRSVRRADILLRPLGLKPIVRSSS